MGQPREGGAQAEVRPHPERQVTVLGAGDVEAIGVREVRRVTVRPDGANSLESIARKLLSALA